MFKPKQDLKIQYQIIDDIKKHIAQARYRSMSLVNKELIRLYWNIGETLERNITNNWGKSFVENLSKEIQFTYPGIRGFSPTNIWSMKQFYVTYKENKKLQQLVGEIPWGQNLIIMARVKDEKAKEHYIRKCITNGWSRGVLEEEIKFDSYKKSLKLQNNFEKTLPLNRLAIYREQFTDEYNLSFLGLEAEHTEKQLEDKIVENIIKVIGSLGNDFCFMSRQFRLEISDKEYFIDILFYHRKLKSLIAIELKVDDFRPEYSQQLNWYLHLLDKSVKYIGDNPSIGILICKSKDRVLVEYALELTTHPIGVSTYTYTYARLPKNISQYLPNEKDLAQLFEKETGES